VVAEVFAGLLDLAIIGIKQFSPAFQRLVEVIGGSTARPPANSCQLQRRSTSQPLVLEQIIHDGLACSLR